MHLSTTSTEKLGSTRAMLDKILKTFFILGLVIAAMLWFIKASLICFVPVFVLPVTFLPIVLTLKVIKAELKSRSVVQSN